MIVAGGDPIKRVQVEQAWQAFRATQLQICSNPSLLENPYFIALQETAEARYLRAFEAWDGRS